MQQIQGVDVDDDIGNTRNPASFYAAGSTAEDKQPQSLQGSPADHSTQQDESAGGPVSAFGELGLDAAERHTPAASQVQGRIDAADVHLGKEANQTQQVFSSHSAKVQLLHLPHLSGGVRWFTYS